MGKGREGGLTAAAAVATAAEGAFNIYLFLIG